jgi:cation diffusion facilitator CzcD-associated flavoprotein CzcO
MAPYICNYQKGHQNLTQMRKIAIMGAGQSGLHLAIRLLKSGYDVTIISERSAGEIFNEKTGRFH